MKIQGRAEDQPLSISLHRPWELHRCGAPATGRTSPQTAWITPELTFLALELTASITPNRNQLRVAAIWSAIGLGPLLLLALLLAGIIPDPEWAGPTFHFYIVSFTSFISLMLAVLMRVVAGQLRDARVLFLSLSFLGIAGIFLTHALTTPGVLVASVNPWVGISSRLSLFVGATFLLISTLFWRAEAQRRIVRRQGFVTWAFVAGLVGYGALALTTSLKGMATGGGGEHAAHQHETAGPVGDYAANAQAAAIPASDTLIDAIWTLLGSQALSLAVGLLTLLMLGVVIVRYVRLYRLSRTPLAAAFLASAILLAQTQTSMVIAPTWHASWWEYHLLMLVSFGAASFGLARQYAQNGSLQHAVGGLLLRDAIDQLQRGYTDVIVALVEAVEAKDPYTRGHTQRVAELSILIGQELKLSPDQLRTVGQAAMLHDIGKIGIPDSVLNKAGSLSNEELAIIRDHPVRGHRIIQNVRSLRNEIGGVRHHHERLDGSGYPDGLRGAEIPLEARIIAVADVFDALTSARPYRGPFPVERALEIIRSEAGTKLDPACVDALGQILPAWTARRAEGIDVWERDAASSASLTGEVPTMAPGRAERRSGYEITSLS